MNDYAVNFSMVQIRFGASFLCFFAIRCVILYHLCFDFVFRFLIRRKNSMSYQTFVVRPLNQTETRPYQSFVVRPLNLAIFFFIPFNLVFN